MNSKFSRPLRSDEDQTNVVLVAGEYAKGIQSSYAFIGSRILPMTFGWCTSKVPATPWVEPNLPGGTARET